MRGREADRDSRDRGWLIFPGEPAPASAIYSA